MKITNVTCCVRNFSTICLRRFFAIIVILMPFISNVIFGQTEKDELYKVTFPAYSSGGLEMKDYDGEKSYGRVEARKYKWCKGGEVIASFGKDTLCISIYIGGSDNLDAEWEESVKEKLVSYYFPYKNVNITKKKNDEGHLSYIRFDYYGKSVVFDTDGSEIIFLQKGEGVEPLSLCCRDDSWDLLLLGLAPEEDLSESYKNAFDKLINITNKMIKQ